MDDLEHSVHIAEQDWESFYEESEECCIEEARLAGLDDSLFSDTDDEKNPTQESIVLHQANPDKLNTGHGAEVQIQSEVNNEAGKKESSEWLGDMADRDKSAEQMGEISLNDSANACAYLTSDISTSGKVISPTDQQENASEPKNFREHDESCREDKLDQVTGEQIQDTKHVVSSEKETASEVTESSATARKEKERWFVTVNDSPTKLRLKSGTYGQKKGKKKKSSRKLVKQTTATEEQSLISNYDKEAEQEAIKKGHKSQDEPKQPLQTYCECMSTQTGPNNVHEGSFSSSLQEVLPHHVKEIGDDYEKPPVPKIHTFERTLCTTRNVVSCAFNFDSNATSDVPTVNQESHFSAFLNSSSQFIPKGSPQVQTNGLNDFMKQLGHEDNTANKPKSIISFTIPDHSMTDDASHVFNDTLEDPSRLNLNACSCNDSSEELQEQEQTEENVSFYQETQNQEPANEVLEAAISSTCPIYALSSFWDEMEKLTINNIVHLRSTHSRCPSSGTVTPEEIDVCLKCKGLLGSNNRSVQNSLMDDTADSDYFTQIDDSKPDRSSCEFSIFSDCDEEYLQILNTSANPSPEPQNVKEQTERSQTTHIPDQELELSTLNSESELVDLKLCLQDGVTQCLCPAIESQNIFLTSELDSNGQFELDSIKRTPSPVLTVGNVLDDQCLLTFSEILVKDIDEDGLQTFYPDRPCCSVVSFPYTHNLSVHETYDDFLSDFEDGNLFFPTMQDKTVPIFSTSGSVVRDLLTPGAKDVIEVDIENNNSPTRVITPFSSQLEMSTSFSEMPKIFFFTSQKSNWRSFISPRRIMHIVKDSVWCQKASSWIFPKDAKKARSYVSGAKLIVHPMHLENTALQQFPEQQEKPHHNVLISKREDILFSVKQADMCLACIAFASWVLKSSNPQSTHMWNAALLANVSAFSAIQYLRKYGKEEAPDDL